MLEGNSLSGPLSLSLTPNSNVSFIDISDNKLQGNIPPCLSGMKDLGFLDLSNNQLSGRVPEGLIMKSSLSLLGLSNNNLSGNVVPSILKANGLGELYLDGNKFSGEMTNIDVSIFEFPTSLREIDLSNNKLYGKLPRWIGNLSDLWTLALSNNSFEDCGPLSHAFYNSSSLVTLDLRGNSLTGSIPKWIGKLSSLSVLLLKANHLQGRIPVQLRKLYSLNIIDLSQNMFSGPIPSCLENLTLPMQDNKILRPDYFELFSEEVEPAIFRLIKLRSTVDYDYPSSYMEEWIELTTKSGSYSYGGYILENMTEIDLSCNKLTGPIPPELGNMSQIHALKLNLSHNKLMRVIPSSFSKLKQIESLDLSYNNLSGEIPNQLVELNYLEVFSVAHNNLSGNIPEKAQFESFVESSYEGNPFLYGPMLHKSCFKTDSPSTLSAVPDDEEDSLLDMYVFRVSFLVSYAVMLLTVFVVLYINPYWRRAWLSFVEKRITIYRYSTVGNFLAYYIFRGYL
ncbi:Detected protein of unknown function [Hibiscus syriacus]|uniref:Uncharacterized protein n=1 Tax=Hibiscus syriacus TaxID=106335 RepID=A0A6A3AI96_HIBSY|nr:Detected protein of unknown function [Hibiscus syriacus]